jgi:transcriptional regulator with XRE-family HTH domain
MAKLQPSALPNIRQRLAAGESYSSIAYDHQVSSSAIIAILYGRNWNQGATEEISRVQAERRNARRALRVERGHDVHRAGGPGGRLLWNEVSGAEGDGNLHSVLGQDARDILNSTFGRWLEQIRFERKMDLAALAEQTGVSIGTISRLERGNAQVTLMTALRLCDGLQVSLAALGKVFLDTISPELAAVGNREGQHMLTIRDLHAYLDYCRRNWHDGCLLLVDMLNRSASRHPAVFKKARQDVQDVVALPFAPHDVEKLLTDASSAPSALLHPPLLEASTLWDLAREGGVVTFADVGAYLQHLRRTGRLTLQKLHQAIGIPFTVLGRLEQGVIEQVKLATAITLDRQWRQEGRVLALFWSATRYTQAISTRTERERNLLACFVMACRWLQQDPHHNGAWLVDLRETIKESDTPRGLKPSGFSFQRRR